MKKINLNIENFDKDIEYYQNRIFYSNRGKCIQNSANVTFNKTLTAEQASYIHAVMVVSDNDFIDYGIGFADIPVELLFTMMTPFHSKLYDKTGKRSKPVLYMAGVTQRCISELIEIVLVKEKKKEQCRKFALNREFVKNYYMAQQEILYLVENNLYNLDTLEQKVLFYATTKAPRGSGFENANRLNSLSVVTVDKLRESRFVFDADFYHSEEGKKFIKAQKLKADQVDSLNCALDFLNKYTNSPQYHESFHLQNAGRMHTVGGCIQLPKWFRDRFILPVNPNNVRLEFDLKSAQLIILCEILGSEDLKNKILDILDEKGSIWSSIGNPEMDKRIKKIIVYAFCFGAEISDLPFLASKEARRKNLGITITKKEVSECLDGLLIPLVNAREEWLKNYTIQKIVKIENKEKLKML